MDFLKEIVNEDHSHFEYHEFTDAEDVEKGDDWCMEDSAVQYKVEYNGCMDRSSNLQRCLRCNKPLYYDRLNLLRHNLKHLQVNLEKLPDEIFQFYEPDVNRFDCYEKPDISSEIIQINNSFNTDTKSELANVQLENSSDHLLDVDKLSIETEHNNNIEFKKEKWDVDTAVIKLEIDENCMDLLFEVENSKTDYKEKNNNRDISINNKEKCDNSVIENEIEEINLESTKDELIAAKSNGDIEDDNIDSETKRQLQRFDGAIIKCEIEEIHSDASIDFYEDEGKTNKHIEDNNIDSAKEKQIILDSSIIKSEIEENNSNDGVKLLDIKNKNEFRKTKATESKKKPRQCHICKKFLSYKQLGQHISEVHIDHKVSCEYCNKIFKCRKTMKSHVKNVHKNLTFRCNHCKNTFNSKDCLQKHMKNVHGKAVACDICGSRLASEMYLSAHMKRVHYDDGKVHSCDICGKIFKSPRYVRIHMKNAHSVSSKKKISSRKK